MAAQRIGISLVALALAFGASLMAASTAQAAIPSNITGNWSGELRWSNGAMPSATLNITQSKPLRGHITVPDKCAGTWREVSRSSDTVRVQFERTSGGGCSSRNQWDVSFLSATQLRGVGVDNHGDSIALSKNGDGRPDNACRGSLCGLS